MYADTSENWPLLIILESIYYVYTYMEQSVAVKSHIKLFTSNYRYFSFPHHHHNYNNVMCMQTKLNPGDSSIYKDKLLRPI